MNTALNIQEWFNHRKIYLEKLSKDVFDSLQTNETLSLSCHWESSQFHRFNQSKVRQSTDVEQATISASLIYKSRSTEFVTTLSGKLELDRDRLIQDLKTAQALVALLPEHPFCPRHEHQGSVESVFGGQGPVPGAQGNQLFDLLLDPVKKHDLAGIFCAGPIMRALLNSLGSRHYFATELYQFDYSLYTGKQRAVKGGYSSRHWNTETYHQLLKEKLKQLEYVDLPKTKVVPGKYRAYLAPDAMMELINTFNWGGPSFRAYKEGQSPLAELHEGKKSLSPLFNLSDDYALGLAPRFNFLGEVCEEKVSIIENGKLKSFLVNTHSALEYKVPTTMASSTESMRSPSVAAGILKEKNILNELGTGLYLDQLHYLNWSDLSHARITGMTRFAALWVENGEIVGPIEDLRFDETLYHLWGSGLKALSEERWEICSNSTYGERSVGGGQVPGILVDDMNFTL